MVFTALQTLRNTLIGCGLAGLASAVTAYHRRSWEAAIVAAACWFILGPLIAFWRYKEQVAKLK